jgi:hypothetical protein
MRSRVGCSALVIVAWAMSGASAARAQLSVEVGATVARYAPLGSFDPTTVHEVSHPSSPDDLSGIALGGELRLWIVPRVGVAVAGSSVSTNVGGGSTPNGYHPPSRAHVSTGSAQLLYRVTGDGKRARVWVSAGGGLVKHGGETYEQFGKPVNFAGVFGVGSALRVTGGLNAELGITTMVYTLNMSAPPHAIMPELSERGRQTDLLLRTGLSYTLR